MDSESLVEVLVRREGRPHPVAGIKFAPDGSPLPQIGNTVICHVPELSIERTALVSLASILAKTRWATAFTLLPSSSYHMTLFGGVNDELRTPLHWPDEVPSDMPIEAVTRLFMNRLQGLRLPSAFAMRPVLFRPRASGSLVIELEPADDDVARDIRGAREALAIVLGLRKPDHQTYRFHITLGYVLDWMQPGDARAFVVDLIELGEAFRARRPNLALGLPAFCIFRTLHSFLPLLSLSR